MLVRNQYDIATSECNNNYCLHMRYNVAIYVAT